MLNGRDVLNALLDDASCWTLLSDDVRKLGLEEVSEMRSSMPDEPKTKINLSVSIKAREEAEKLIALGLVDSSTALFELAVRDWGLLLKDPKALELLQKKREAECELELLSLKAQVQKAKEEREIMFSKGEEILEFLVESAREAYLKNPSKEMSASFIKTMRFRVNEKKRCKELRLVLCDEIDDWSGDDLLSYLFAKGKERATEEEGEQLRPR